MVINIFFLIGLFIFDNNSIVFDKCLIINLMYPVSIFSKQVSSKFLILNSNIFLIFVEIANSWISFRTNKISKYFSDCETVSKLKSGA